MTHKDASCKWFYRNYLLTETLFKPRFQVFKEMHESLRTILDTTGTQSQEYFEWHRLLMNWHADMQALTKWEGKHVDKSLWDIYSQNLKERESSDESEGSADDDGKSSSHDFSEDEQTSNEGNSFLQNRMETLTID